MRDAFGGHAGGPRTRRRRSGRAARAPGPGRRRSAPARPARRARAAASAAEADSRRLLGSRRAGDLDPERDPLGERRARPHALGNRAQAREQSGAVRGLDREPRPRVQLEHHRARAARRPPRPRPRSRARSRRWRAPRSRARARSSAPPRPARHGRCPGGASTGALSSTACRIRPVASSTPAPIAPWCRLARPREAWVGSRVIDMIGIPRCTITRTSGTPSVEIAASSGCTSSSSSTKATSGWPPSAYSPEMMLAAW